MQNPNRTEAAGHHYRADIDGLRSIAILPVLLYHFRISPFSGGYVGVDIFFVISGYLITSLIYTEMREQRFSILRFYERRVRRILPALFVVLAVTVVLGFVILFPDDLRRFSESLVATVFFSSNFEFWREAGYFNAPASVKPLLHTWSLAVEEQFYFIYPAILYVFRNASRPRLGILLGIILLTSFAISIWLVGHHPTAAFYLLPSRMWELMLGAVLAIGAVPKIRGRVVLNVVALIGAGLIAFSIFAYDSDTVFPGLSAAAPCVGAALIIYAGSCGQTVVSYILSRRLPVFIGLISYSLYLWHWPIFVFATYLVQGPLGLGLKVVLMAVSVALAWLSFRFVERPFRGKTGALTRAGVLRLAGALSGVALLIGIGGYATKGLPQRYSGQVAKLLSASGRHGPRHAECFDELQPRALQRARAHGFCVLGDPRAVPSFILWGDSHAAALLTGVSDAAKALHRSGFLASSPSCPPLLGVRRVEIKNEACPEFNDAVLRAAQAPEIHEVILAARWALHAEGTRYKFEEGNTVHLVDSQSPKPSLAENKQVFLRGLSRTLAALEKAHKRVIIVGPVPEVGRDVPEALARAKLFGSDADIGPTVREFEERQHFVLATLSALQARFPFVLLRPDHVLCTRQTCMTERDGEPLYVDSHHLNAAGSRQLIPILKSAL